MKKNLKLIETRELQFLTTPLPPGFFFAFPSSDFLDKRQEILDVSIFIYKK